MFCRNHILDKGLRVRSDDGAICDLKKSHFRTMIDSDGPEFKVCLKLSHELIDVRGQGRQRVLPAAQLLSYTVGKAILQHFGPSFLPQSEAIICINDWFDVMNSHFPVASKNERCGFGLREESQLSALDKMENFVQRMEFCNYGKKYSRAGYLSIPFQRGILVSIKSTKALYGELKAAGTKYFLTSKVNSDCLENFFSRLRSIGGDNTHPGPASAVERVRILLIGKDPQHLVTNPAVKNFDNEDVVALDANPTVHGLLPADSFETFISKELTADLQHPSDPDQDDEDLNNLPDPGQDDKDTGTVSQVFLIINFPKCTKKISFIFKFQLKKIIRYL